jgi:endonuclease/exonuclease/phosphatase (EEP) superfamily protein YafD
MLTKFRSETRITKEHGRNKNHKNRIIKGIASAKHTRSAIMAAVTTTVPATKEVNNNAPLLHVIVQNLQKKPGLASGIIASTQPDVFLAQEINLESEKKASFPASYVSRRGYGTAIHAKTGSNISNIRRISSPHPEHLWTIVKKTTIATYNNATIGSSGCGGVELVTFHGYNGWPRRDEVHKLVDHVNAALAVVAKQGPAIFAGDFNTWTKKHLEAVGEALSRAGFVLVYSWPYPGNTENRVLDHVYVRGVRLVEANTFENASDHLGASLVLEIMKEAEGGSSVL